MAVTYEKGKLYQLPLTKLIPDPEQPRKFFDAHVTSGGRSFLFD